MQQRKAKVKLSLSLVRYHAMMMYPLLNKATCHEDLRGSGGIAPHILNLGNWWSRVVSFMPWPLYPRRKRPRHQLDRRLGGPQSM